MTSLLGHRAAEAEFFAAINAGALHHAWLLAGPEGIGKAQFAARAALRLLVDGQSAGLDVPMDHPAERLIAAGSHPDFRVLQRLPKDADKPGDGIARNISIAQVRGLGRMFATSPALGPRRVVIIDAADDLERGAANALLKSLEDPPAGTTFLLVAHAPGRLLATIRSRCRVLRFEPLSDAETAAAMTTALPDADRGEIAALVGASGGSPGRGLRYAGLDLAGLDAAMTAIVRDGDPSNARRSSLAKALGGKVAAARYQVFLERAPAFIAATARKRSGDSLAVALDAYAAANDLADSAIGLTLDASATVFEMGTLLVRLHQPSAGG